MENPKGYVNPELLITAAELHALIPQVRDLSNPQHPVLIDLRRPDLFANGHIPGAAHLDLYGISLIDTDEAPLRAFMWIIEHLLGTRGVTLDRTVIVYDEATGDRVSRAFWFLEYFGHQHVRVLDGGFGAWTRAGYEVETHADAQVDTAWAGERHPDLLATRHDVLARLESRDAVIVDARSTEEYCGTMVRAARGGAIPHAVRTIVPQYSSVDRPSIMTASRESSRASTSWRVASRSGWRSPAQAVSTCASACVSTS